MISTVAVLSLFLIAADAGSFFLGNSQTPLNTLVDVPGKNPLYYCQEPSTYSLAIENVDLTPNPPVPGSKLLIEASGTFNDEVEEGSYINLVVKYGLITLIKTKADLCDQLDEVGEGCPIEGDKVIRKEVDIPKEVPPGTYHVLADVYSKDDKKITCLETSIHFGIK